MKPIPSQAGYRKLAGIGALAIVLAFFIPFLSAPLWRILWKGYGRLAFWLLGAGVGILLASQVSLGFILLSIVLTMGLYSELEAQGKAGFWSAGLSLLVGGAVLLISPYSDDLRAGLEQVMATTGSGTKSWWSPKKETVLALVPAGIFLTTLMNLAFGLAMDKKLGQLFGLQLDRVASEMKLLEFRVPDLMIWVTMLSFLLSFVVLPNPEWNTWALNVFLVMAGVYFFQGLAVAEVAMIVWKVGFLLRLLFYLLIVGQLFFLLSLLGIVDYWIDFRRLFRKKSSERLQNSGENL